MLNLVKIEGTLKRIPAVYDLPSGERRTIFTVRIPRKNSEIDYDYIDCCAYGNVANSLGHVKVGAPVRIEGRLTTYRDGKGNKRTGIVVDKWSQRGRNADPEA